MTGYSDLSKPGDLSEIGGTTTTLVELIESETRGRNSDIIVDKNRTRVWRATENRPRLKTRHVIVHK